MKPLIILGMHRSGTSLIAELLNDSGVFMGNRLNSHFESIDYLKINQYLLNFAHAEWDHPNNFEFLLQQEIKKNEVIKLLKRKIKSISFRCSFWGHKSLFNKNINNYWGWKEPRTTITFPIWKEIYPNAKILIIYRNGIDVAASLYNREKIRESNIDKSFYSIRCLSIDESFKLWEEYNKYLNYHINIFNKNDICEIKYEDFLMDPEKKIKYILNDFLGMENFKITPLIYKINNENSYKFIKNEELMKLYFKYKNSEMMKKIGYNNI